MPYWCQRIYREGLDTERPWARLPELRKVHDPFAGGDAFREGIGPRTATSYEESRDGLAAAGFALRSN